MLKKMSFFVPNIALENKQSIRVLKCLNTFAKLKRH